MVRTVAIVSVIVIAMALASFAQGVGELKLDVLGDIGRDAVARAQVFTPDGKQVAEVAPGHGVTLPEGDYRLVLPIVGGKITRDDVHIETGHTHTVLIDDVAVLSVTVRNRDGGEPGYGVGVTTTDSPHAKVASFSSGEKMLFAPNQVDVAVDAPPQGYTWHAVALRPGHLTHLNLDEAVPGELVIQPELSQLPLDKLTRVTVYEAGTQRQIAQSPPGPEHRLKLDPGHYDVYVENNSGKGVPYAILKDVPIAAGSTVERHVALDK